MNRHRRLIAVTLLESFATISVERGIFFYAQDRLDFSGALNLVLALAFGLAYVGGALASQAFCRRISEKRLLLAVIAAQAAAHLALAAWPTATGVFVFSTLLGMLNGLKWPVIESYVCAGWNPRQAARAVGAFNMSWAAAVPAALVAVGPLVKISAGMLFLVPAALNVLNLLLCLPLRQRPLHMPADHPDRPVPGVLRRMKALTVASRSLMLASYGAMWILAALMPILFSRLGFGVSWAAGLSGLLDACRLATFGVLLAWTGWHNRVLPLAGSMVVLPAGFFMVLFGGNLPVVLAGEVLFGVAAGVIYYAALYYAMVVSNASVDAGGGHEGLIGLGFAVGPAAGLAGVGLAGVLGNADAGMVIGIAPVFAVCSAVAIVASGRAAAAARSLDRPAG